MHSSFNGFLHYMEIFKYFLENTDNKVTLSYNQRDLAFYRAEGWKKMKMSQGVCSLLAWRSMGTQHPYMVWWKISRSGCWIRFLSEVCKMFLPCCVVFSLWRTQAGTHDWCQYRWYYLDAITVCTLISPPFWILLLLCSLHCFYFYLYFNQMCLDVIVFVFGVF